MALAGRKQTPTALKIVRGNPGKRPLPENEPRPAMTKLPRAPAHLNATAKKHWRGLVKLLANARLLTDIDRPALEMLCEAYGRWTDALMQVQEFGMVVKSQNGFPVQSPYLGIANRAFDQLRAMLSEFGMTPAARPKIDAGDGSKSASDWSDF